MLKEVWGQRKDIRPGIMIKFKSIDERVMETLPPGLTPREFKVLDYLHRPKKEGDFSRIWRGLTKRYVVIPVEEFFIEWDTEEHRPNSYALKTSEMIQYCYHWFWPLDSRMISAALDPDLNVEYIASEIISRNSLGPDGAALTVKDIVRIHGLEPREIVSQEW